MQRTGRSSTVFSLERRIHLLTYRTEQKIERGAKPNQELNQLTKRQNQRALTKFGIESLDPLTGKKAVLGKVGSPKG